MALYQVSSGQTINANDINQLVNTLMAPSGAQEIGFFAITFNASNSGYIGANWIKTTSQGSTPVSITLSNVSSAGCGTVQTSSSSAYGFQASAASSFAGGNLHFNANYTVQY